MKETSDAIQEGKDQVDNYIITTCITLIGSFIIIFSIKKPESLYSAYSYIITIFSLIVSLLASFWHKVRHPKRKAFFEREHKELINDASKLIADFADNFIIPLGDKQLIEKGIKYPCPKLLEKAKLSERGISLESDETARNIIMTHLQKLDYDMRELRERAFNRPLKENNSRILYYMDFITRKIRYVMFIVGITFFFISIILNLL